MLLINIRYNLVGDMDDWHTAVLKCAECCGDLAIAKGRNLPDAIGQAVAGYIRKFGRDPIVEQRMFGTEVEQEMLIELSAILPTDPNHPEKQKKTKPEPATEEMKK